jgi:hypothetical protein
MTKLFLPYNKSILKTTIIISIFLTLLSSLVFVNTDSTHSLLFLAIAYYIFWMMSGGFLLSSYYFEISRKNEYYFYYNLGISKVKLIFFTYLLHFIFILPFLYILKYV